MAPTELKVGLGPLPDLFLTFALTLCALLNKEELLVQSYMTCAPWNYFSRSGEEETKGERKKAARHECIPCGSGF